MSVSGISNSLASNQISAVAPNAQRSAQTQKQDFAASNLDVPSDVATFQQLNASSSAGTTPGTLTAVQKAYASLQQIANEPIGTTTLDPTNADPTQAKGGPVRRPFMDPTPIHWHDPMPPVERPPVGLPNPIRGQYPMPPVYRHPVIGLPNPINEHDPMPPVYRRPVSVIA